MDSLVWNRHTKYYSEQAICRLVVVLETSFNYRAESRLANSEVRICLVDCQSAVRWLLSFPLVSLSTCFCRMSFLSLPFVGSGREGDEAREEGTQYEEDCMVEREQRPWWVVPPQANTNR